MDASNVLHIDTGMIQARKTEGQLSTKELNSLEECFGWV